MTDEGSGNLRASYPSYFRRKTFNMIFLPFEDTLGDEHGEVCVLHTEFFDMSIEPLCTSMSTSGRQDYDDRPHLGYIPRYYKTKA
jgi:hypothetical protein